MDPQKSLSDDVKAKAEELRDDAVQAVQTEVETHANAVRDEAVDQVSQFANAADAAASEFPQNSIQAQAADQIAAQVEEVAHRLRSTDLAQVTRDVSNFARKNPAIFIGAAAIAGFAATRFLKARDPQRSHVAYGTDPWGTDGGVYHD